MSRLGELLKRLRRERDRSRCWVERQSRERYPDESERHVSHSYLRQLEEGVRQRPNPLKLQTLAELYQIDYRELMAAAGYLVPPSSAAMSAEVSGDGMADADAELVRAAREWLERNGIRFRYHLRGMIGLSKESLVLVNRLVTALNLQERQADKAPSAADAQPAWAGQETPHETGEQGRGDS